MVLGQTPYRFTGLNTIGKIFFILDIILLLLFTGLLSMRFAMRPIVFLRSLHHPGEALFFGAYFVSISLVLTCSQIYGVPSSGPWLPTALKVCFWIYVACAFSVATFQYATLFVAERLPVSSAMPAWVFPAYPFLVTGSLAGALLPDQPMGFRDTDVYRSSHASGPRVDTVDLYVRNLPLPIDVVRIATAVYETGDVHLCRACGIHVGRPYLSRQTGTERPPRGFSFDYHQSRRNDQNPWSYEWRLSMGYILLVLLLINRCNLGRCEAYVIHSQLVGIHFPERWDDIGLDPDRRST